METTLKNLQKELDETHFSSLMRKLIRHLLEIIEKLQSYKGRFALIDAARWLIGA